MPTQKRRERAWEESISGKKIKHLQCPLCSDIYDDPITLQCGHSFCRTCLLSKDVKKCGICEVSYEVDACTSRNIALTKMADEDNEDMLGKMLLNATAIFDTDRIDMLLERGANIEYYDENSPGCVTPLLNLCKHGDDAAYVMNLMSTFDAAIEGFDEEDRGVLDWACYNRMGDEFICAILEKLRQKRSKATYINGADFNEGRVLPIKRCIEYGYSRACLCLVELGVVIMPLADAEKSKLKELVYNGAYLRGVHQTMKDEEELSDENSDNEFEDDDFEDEDEDGDEELEVNDVSQNGDENLEEVGGDSSA